MTTTQGTLQFQLPGTVLPNWVKERSAPETIESASFGSGAALTALYLTTSNFIMGVPNELLRLRLALDATVKTLKLQGRGETAQEVRDYFYLTAPDDEMGPVGLLLDQWRGVARINLRTLNWHQAFVDQSPAPVRETLLEMFNEVNQQPSADQKEVTGSPVCEAVAMVSRFLSLFPRYEDVALQLADIVLARALRANNVMPLFAHHVRRKDLLALREGDNEAFKLAMHRMAALGARDATRMAHDLSERAAKLKEQGTKLRTKGRDKAIELFMSEDAVFPTSSLYPKIRGTNITMTKRSARRLCSRLVELGVVRELTGRSTFRMYGL